MLCRQVVSDVGDQSSLRLHLMNGLIRHGSVVPLWCREPRWLKRCSIWRRRREHGLLMLMLWLRNDRNIWLLPEGVLLLHYRYLYR